MFVRSHGHMCNSTQGLLCPNPIKNTSKHVDTLTIFSKTLTKGQWPLDDLWPHFCWGHMCDSAPESLCQSPMGIHQCMWIQWSILQNIPHTTYYTHTLYRMSDHKAAFWTKFGWDKNCCFVENQLDLQFVYNLPTKLSEEANK